MRILSFITLVLCTSLSQASPLVGYSTLEPANLYQIKNVQKKTIFSATADTVRRVELRDGLAVVQTSTGNVSLIREDGTVLVSTFGSEFGISKKLFSVYSPGGIGAVYTLDGAKIFPAADESQTRPVREIHIANDRFAVVDRMTNILTVYDSAGKDLFNTNDAALVMISDGFLITKSALDTLSLYDADLDLITTDSSTSMVQLSDQFAGFIDSYGSLRLFSREGEFSPLLNVTRFSLTNTFAMVTDSFGLALYGKDKSMLETPTVRKSFAAFHQLFAYVSNTGGLWVKNEETEESFVVNRADFYAMSDDLLVVKNGMGDYAVYSLAAGSFGRVVHSTLDHTIARFQVGNGVVSFETTLQTGASNNAKVMSFVGTASKSVLVDESPVNKVNLSLNREELNWK